MDIFSLYSSVPLQFYHLTRFSLCLCLYYSPVACHSAYHSCHNLKDYYVPHFHVKRFLKWMLGYINVL